MNLSGTCLIAMPAMGDPRFAKSVVFLCAHSAEGAMGLVVNKPISSLTFGGLLDQVKIPRGPATPDLAVQFGGPVEPGRGFVLHSGDYDAGVATMRVPGGLGMTATLDVLRALADGAGPSRALLTLGYAGWGPGQLEGEISRNDWLTCAAPASVLFAPDNARKWAMALALLGVDPLSLSSTGGRA